jgi:hypothetical protein
MSILLCLTIAWVTFCLLFVGLELIFLLIVEHASNTCQATIADERISDQARHTAKLAQLEGTVTLAPRDAIPMAAGAVADRTNLDTGAVIIRDPRLTRARNLSGHGGAVGNRCQDLGNTGVGAISEAMEDLSAEISYD